MDHNALLWSFAGSIAERSCTSPASCCAFHESDCVQSLHSADTGEQAEALGLVSEVVPAGEFEVSTPEDVHEALESARKAQPGWAELGFDERARFMYRALAALVERQCPSCRSNSVRRLPQK